MFMSQLNQYKINITFLKSLNTLALFKILINRRQMFRSNLAKNSQLSTLIPSERPTFNNESEPTSPMIKRQIKDKFKTFTNWNYRELTQRIKKAQKKQQILRDNTLTDHKLISALLNISSNAQKEKKKEVKHKHPVMFQQLTGVKAERRERFKKSQNPLYFIKHYMERQNFKPEAEEMFLIQKTIELKQYTQSFGVNLDIQKVLRKIYYLMNLSVDFNQLRFLNLLILLAGDICYQAKDQNRAFYFYNQSRVASTYANLNQIKTQSLMGMGLVAMSIRLFDEAIVIFKKNLQYAWSSKNHEAELLIYDYLGECYYSQGNMKEAQYYHTRYIQSEIEGNDSAIKKISNEMLSDYYRFTHSLEKDNLTSLFIEYLNLPITDFQKVPPPQNIKSINKIYGNYKNGQSPRKGRPCKKFDFKDFPQVHKQIQQLINEDYEFKTQIPNPDMHRNYIVEQKYGRKKKSMEFQQSSQFHRIIGAKPPKLNFQKIYKYPLQKRVDRALSQKQNPSWWQQMLRNTKKERTQKVGILKEKIRISHLSYQKYPEEKKRSQSLKNQKIKQSFNKTLLDWIDPLK